VLGALADGADARPAGAQFVVDHDPPADLESGRGREVDVGPDAGGDHDEVGFDRLVAGEADPFDASGALDRFGDRRGPCVDAQRAQRAR